MVILDTKDGVMCGLSAEKSCSPMLSLLRRKRESDNNSMLMVSC